MSRLARSESKKRAREEAEEEDSRQGKTQTTFYNDNEREIKHKYKREHWENDRRRLHGSHFCIKLKGSKKEEGNGYIDNRSFCIMCQVKKISYKCEQCNVFLCIQDKEGGTCFHNFHTQVKFTNSKNS